MERAVQFFSTTGCSRCESEGHELLAFKRFKNPVVIGDMKFLFWAMCPNTYEPILLTTIENGETAKPIEEVLEDGS